MYPLGLLFGYIIKLGLYKGNRLISYSFFRLGFDTASEVALLGLSVLAANNGFPAVLVILLPLLFVAGMSLVLSSFLPLAL